MESSRSLRGLSAALPLLYSSILLAFAVGSGLGETAGIGSPMEIAVSALICTPIYLAGRVSPVLAAEISAALLLPLKILMNAEWASSGSFHLLAVVLAVVFAAEAPSGERPGGRASFLLLAYFALFQAARATSFLDALHYWLDLFGFLLVVYWVAPRIPRSRCRGVLRAFSNGVALSLGMMFLNHDWGLGRRVGPDLLLSTNTVGLTAALAILVAVPTQDAGRGRFTGLVLYSVLALGVLVSASRTAILLSLLAGFSLVRPGTRLRGALFFAIFVVGGVGLLLLAPAFVDARDHALKGVAEMDPEKVSRVRVDLHRQGLDTLLDQPLLGVGFSNFSREVGVERPNKRGGLPAHSLFLRWSVECGLLGLALVCLGLARFVSRPVLRSPRAIPITIAMLLVALLQGDPLSLWYALPWVLTYRHLEAESGSPPSRDRLSLRPRAAEAAVADSHRP